MVGRQVVWRSLLELTENTKEKGGRWSALGMMTMISRIYMYMMQIAAGVAPVNRSKGMLWHCCLCNLETHLKLHSLPTR